MSYPSAAEGVTRLNDATGVSCASQGLEYCVERLSGELLAFYGVKLADAANTKDARSKRSGV